MRVFVTLKFKLFVNIIIAWYYILKGSRQLNKYFAYKGNKDLITAKKEEVNSIRFHLGNKDIAIKRCNRNWGEGNFKLYRFIDFNDINTYEIII